MSTDTVGTESRAISRRVYWRRSTEASMTWWPWGAFLMLALLLLFLWGAFNTASGMQAQVRDAVAKNLLGADVELQAVTASGQEVELVAIAKPAQAAQIRSIAQATECETWAGSLTCPNSVGLTLVDPPEQTSLPAADTGRHHEFSMTRADDGLTVSGEVSDSATRATFMALLRSGFSSVDGGLEVTEETDASDSERAIRRAAGVLSVLESGQAHWRGGTLEIVGVVTPENEGRARRAFLESPDDVGTLVLTVADRASTCNEQFNAALRASEITFATGSAAIAEPSAAILERLAEIANDCPGSIVIEGHTDNIGSPEANLRLSQARAAAVRERLISLGISEETLQAQGFGAARPVADNETADGRARNRRIVVRIEG